MFLHWFKRGRPSPPSSSVETRACSSSAWGSRRWLVESTRAMTSGRVALVLASWNPVPGSTRCYLVFLTISFLASMSACWEEAILDHSTNLDKKFGSAGMRELWYNPRSSACQEAHLVPLPCDVHIDGSRGHACVTQCLLADNKYQVEFLKHFYRVKFPSFEVMR